MKKNLIFVHGFRGSALGLEKLASYFDKKDYNVYLPDLPPAGDESLPEYSPRLYARFLANYIKDHKIKQPILIGHSMGSIIVAAMAERYPDLIGKKVIFLSPISVSPSGFIKFISPLSAMLPNKLIGFITTKFLFVPKDKDLLKETLLLTYHCGDHYSKKTDILKAARFSTTYTIGDFTFEKTPYFISGENDRLIPKKKTESLVQLLEAKSTYIKNSGHLLNYENPSDTAAAIKRFIKD